MEEVPATDEDLKLLSSDVGKKIIEALAKHAKLERQIYPDRPSRIGSRHRFVRPRGTDDGVRAGA